jgi:hypothetical protein
VRFLRALAAAASVAAAFGMATWAGHIGASSFGRGLLAVLVGIAAFLILTFLVPLIALEDDGGDVGCALTLPTMALIVATVWLTAIDIEVRHGQWQDVVVQEETCQSTDSGCSWTYRVSDARTERDLGWIGCNDDSLNPGDATRVHVDPAGKHRPALEPCAHTAHGWTIGLRVVQGLWVLVLLGVFVGALLWLDDW